MFKQILFVGAGTAAALYFMDEKRGKKRRARFKKQFQHAMNVAGERLNEYSQEFGSRAGVWTRELGQRSGDLSINMGNRAGEWIHQLRERAPEYMEKGKHMADDFAKNGSRGWAPSARLIGAVGSAMAFYGAGRRGVSGAILRTLSLGLFTRALMAPR